MDSLEALRQGRFAGQARVSLKCGLSDFPVDLFQLADSLEILDLSGNRLRRLPDELPRLHKLRVIFCSDNDFDTLPEVLGQCPQLEMIGFKANRIRDVPATALPPKLRWLILTDNCIEQLPEALGDCRDLQKLMLAGNRLTRLPASMARLHKLELLRIAANRLQALPDALLDLPRLAWLAFSGNPCAADTGPHHALPPIDWPELSLETLLGEGASGFIHQARWQAQPEQPIAVKLFKGAMTSDGLPHCEMGACLQAGAHPNLIPVLGTLTGHPEATPGLLMPLIAPRYQPLAGPPSLSSCTRDVYPVETSFSLHQCLRLAADMASVGAHLHARGILHGDFYAHNILHDPSGHALLGDFGAASCYDSGHRQTARALQAIEIRAFGCLLEELCAHCPQLATDSDIQADWLALQRQCLTADRAARPTFAEAHQHLSDWQHRYLT